MGRIKTDTVYRAIFIKTSSFTGSWTPEHLLILGTFITVRLHRFGDSLIVFYDPTNGLTYPWDAVTTAVPD